MTAEYDEQDRLRSFGGVTYGYRDSGELAWKKEGTAETTYSYDNRGNLRKVMLPVGPTIEYEVDGLGRRVGRKKGTDHVRWIYDGKLRIVGEVDGAGNLTQYVYATRPNVPEYMLRGGHVYRILTDQLGSVRLVVHASTGEVKERHDYDAWGELDVDFVKSGWTRVPFGFAGGLYDADTGLVRFGARDYEPETGRWTAKDPVRFAAGDTNLYGYVLSDPLNRMDPTGFFPFDGGDPPGIPGPWGPRPEPGLGEGGDFGGGGASGSTADPPEDGPAPGGGHWVPCDEPDVGPEHRPNPGADDCFWKAEAGKCLSRTGSCARAGGECIGKTPVTCSCKVWRR